MTRRLTCLEGYLAVLRACNWNYLGVSYVPWGAVQNNPFLAWRPLEGLVGQKGGREMFCVLFLWHLAVQTDWYRNINTFATHAVLKGVLGVAQRKMSCGSFPSQGFVCSQGHGRWSAEPGMVCRGRNGTAPGSHLHVLEGNFGSGSGFLASKLGAVLLISQRINNMEEEWDLER